MIGSSSQVPGQPVKRSEMDDVCPRMMVWGRGHAGQTETGPQVERQCRVVASFDQPLL